MLDGLSAIDWSSLTTAYGAATRVPELLRALASADSSERRSARDELASSLHHQESVYDATAAAVPFLVELALDSSVGDRHLLLSLLAGVALGDPSAFVVEGGLAREELLVDDEDGPSTATWTGVFEAVPALGKLLDDPDPSVRAAAALILGVFPSQKKSPRALGKALKKERDENARASLLLALGLLARGASATTEAKAFEAALDDPSAIVRAAAAIASAHLAGDRIDARALAALDLASAPAASVPVPWFDGDLSGLARRVRGTLRIEPPEIQLAELWRRLDAGERTPAVIELAGRLFDRLVPKTPPDGNEWLLGELTDVQRSALRAVALLDRCAYSTRSRGLFFSSATVKRFLGETPPGALDQLVSFGPDRAWPAWKALRAVLWDAIPEHELLRGLSSQLAPDVRAAIAEEGLRGDYELGAGRPAWAFLPVGADTEPKRRHQERLLLLLARIAAGAGDAGRAFIARCPLPKAPNATGFELACLVALAADGEPIDSARVEAAIRVVVDAPPILRRPEIVRLALDLLPPDRATALVLDVPLYSIVTGGKGAVTVVPGPGWDYVDRAGGAEGASKIVDAIEAWAEHVPQKPPEFQKPLPRERALALLTSFGDAAVPALRASLARGHRHADVIAAALGEPFATAAPKKARKKKQ